MVLPPDEDRETELVKVVDFGIAKLRDQAGAPTLTQTGTVVGTPYYMSPEQCRGEALDARSDVYSLGAMLYEMLAGVPPFMAETLAGIISKHLFDAPPPLARKLGVPATVEAAIMRALAKDPDGRQPDAAAFGRELLEAERDKQAAEAEARRAEEERLREESRLEDESARHRAEEESRLLAAKQQREREEEEKQREAEARRRAEETERKRHEAEESALREREDEVETRERAAAIEATTPAGSIFTTADIAEPASKGRGVLIVAVIIALVAVGGFAAWLFGGGRGEQPVNTAARLSPVRPTAGSVMRNRLGVEMVYVPAGEFMMGSEKYDSEKPVHRVTIREGFWMGRYEVTQAEWQAVMGNNPSNFKGNNLPFETVSWYDAQSFIQKMNAQNDGFTYRLPTEAEWEYACRAGTTGEYAGDLDAMAWYGNNSGRQRLDAAEILRTDSSNYYKRITENGGQTHPVGSKLPNALGLYDMHGNVWEWCEDWHHDSYAGAPVDGSAWLSGGEQKYRVLRGGSWNFNASILRSANRFWLEPGARNNYVGFRVVAFART